LDGGYPGNSFREGHLLCLFIGCAISSQPWSQGHFEDEEHRCILERVRYLLINLFFTHRPRLNRKKLRVGVPRVLNIYTYAPLFNEYLESLGVQPESIIYSDYTSSDLYRAGASRAAQR
jgi:hypothetical protein